MTAKLLALSLLFLGTTVNAAVMEKSSSNSGSSSSNSKADSKSNPGLSKD